MRTATAMSFAASRSVIARSPPDAIALVTYGAQLADIGDVRVAGRWIERAAAISPRDPELCEAAAALALRAGRYRDAERWLRRALASEPWHPSRHAALARAERSLSDHERWPKSIRRGLALGPATAEVWRVASALYRHGGRLATARAAGRSAVCVAPADPDALVETARADHSLGLAQSAITLIERALASAPGRSDHASLAILVRTYASPITDLSLAVRRHAAIARRHPAKRVPIRDPSPDRRLRIGYVSADLRDHPVGHNMVGLIEGHDRARFDVICYASVAQPDALTERILAASRAVRWTFGASDDALADIVEDDRIDILVHLAARFSGNRPDMPFRRAAPVQLAMHDATSAGTDDIDATLSDRNLHPADSAEYFAEPVRMLPVFYHFAAAAVPLLDGTPVRRNGFVTFGSANNPAKWSPATLTLWSEVLQRLPTARLWLKFQDRTNNDSTRAVLRAHLRGHGIPIDRVDFGVQTLTKADHLAALSAIDIALDTCPFGGATASFEALWMGIPVVTLSGDRLAGRTTAMLSRHVGLDDLIAETSTAYVDIACRLSADLDRLNSLRQSLRLRLAASRLLDRDSYVRGIEQSYLDVWASACKRHHVSR